MCAMKTIAIGSFLVLFALVATFSATTPTAFAQMTASVSVPAGSSVPGCEETNECWIPNEVTVDVGGEVTWSNDDSAAHTVTSASPSSPSEEVGALFDSSLFMAGTTFSVVFDDYEEGEYPYFCIVHPWMQGIVNVGAAMAEEEPMMEEEAMMMSGVNLDLDIDPMLPFDNTVNDMVTLSFTAKSEELKGDSGTVTHLDYKVMIAKDGNEIWSEQFHEHDGNLELQITPSEGSFTVTGGEEVGSSETKAFMVSGPVFMDNGNYGITAQIVGIEFNPLPTPLTDEFNMQVVPEFGPIVMVILAVAIIGTIVVTTKSRVILKL